MTLTLSKMTPDGPGFLSQSGLDTDVNFCKDACVNTVSQMEHKLYNGFPLFLTIPCLVMN